MFVATFIGSPAMNLISGTCRDGSAVLSDGAVLPISLAAAADTPLTIGVRPEHIDIVTGDDGVAARLVALEPTGAETVVMAELADAVVTVVTKDRVALKSGDPIRLRPALDKQLYFDADGQRISTGERS